MRAFDRLPNESLEEYEMFLAYAQQTPGARSLTAVAQAFGVREDKVIDLAERNAWVERAAAFDRYNAIEWQRAAMIKSAEVRYLTMVALASVLTKLITYLNGLDPKYFALDEMKVLLEWSDKAAKIANMLKDSVEASEPELDEVLAMARHFRDSWD